MNHLLIKELTIHFVTDAGKSTNASEKLNKPLLEGKSMVNCPVLAPDVRQHDHHSLEFQESMSTITNPSHSNCSFVQHNHQHHSQLLSTSTPPSSSHSDRPLFPSETVYCVDYTSPASSPNVSMSSYNTNTVTVTTTSGSSSKNVRECSFASDSCPSTIVICKPIINSNQKPCTFNVIDPDSKMDNLHVSGGHHSSNVRLNHHQQHSWSKSETNLCGKQVELESNGGSIGGGCCPPGNPGAFKLSVFGVVSLNDLQETDEAPFSHAAGRPMNDLSKYHPTLNNISNDDICAKPEPE